ncbi:hypothetical protein V6255_18800, partial [Psychromonas arctica]
DQFGDLYVRAINNDMVPLSELCTVTVVAEPRSLPHINQLNSATIGAVLTPGVTMVTAITFFQGLSTTKLPQ